MKTMSFFLIQECGGHILDRERSTSCPPRPCYAADNRARHTARMGDGKNVLFSHGPGKAGVSAIRISSTKDQGTDKTAITARQICKPLKGCETSLFKGTFPEKGLPAAIIPNP